MVCLELGALAACNRHLAGAAIAHPRNGGLPRRSTMKNPLIPMDGSPAALRALALALDAMRGCADGQQPCSGRCRGALAACA